MGLIDQPTETFLFQLTYIGNRMKLIRPMRDIVDRHSNKRVMKRKAPKKKRGR